MASCVIFQPTVFPDTHYIHRIINADVVILLDRAQFTRKTIHHRIFLPYGTLTVPVQHSKTGERQKFSDLKIDQSESWRPAFLKLLEKWYNLPVPLSVYSAFDPFLLESFVGATFLSYRSIFMRFLNQMWMPRVVFESDLFEGQSPHFATGVDRLVSLCARAGCDVYLTGKKAAETYSPASAFHAAGIRVRMQNLQFPRFLTGRPSYALKDAEAPTSSFNYSVLDAMMQTQDTHVADWINYLRGIRDEGWSWAEQ
jgi:hypothetical protein